ncbi:carbohydrate binding domain-containing protein [Halpernia sp. GG3]
MKTKFLSFLIVVFSFAFGFAQELVTNGDFNAGYTGWSGGNAANVVTVGGNSYYQTNVTTPGQPAYTNNLSYVLSLTAGTKYTLKFDSWSDAPRGFIVGLGLNHNPYTSVTAQQNITTAVTTYTLSFTPTVSDSDSRIIFDMGAEVGIVRIDNVSLKVFVQDPTTDASLSDLKVKGTTIAGFLTGTKSYTYELPVGTTIVPQITSATTTNAAASKIITQATALPGSATVKVTAVDGTTTSTYTVNFIADLPNASPYHTTTGTLLPLNFNTNATVNDTGTPSTATVWNPDYTFGGFTSIKNLATSGTNNAIYTDFTTGYGAGSAANRNVSSYSYFNFDYFVPANETPGAHGDEFYFDLISNSPVKESNYEIKPTGGDAVLVKGSWQTISVPLATFVAKGFNPATFFQFKLGADFRY